jgi:hypothetical protein
MFNEHGGFNVTLQGDVLVVVVTGAWNAETAKAYQDVVQSSISSIKGKAWGLICNLSEWELCTPDCESMIIDLVTKCRHDGMRREAFICETDSVKLDLFYKRDKSDVSQVIVEQPQRRFFNNDQSAWQWLEAGGYGL